jgi:hypothetical protein
MGKGKTLVKRQKEVINDLFSGGKGEQEVLRKHNVSGALFERWLNDSAFISEIKRRVRWSELMLLRNKALASQQLVKLSNCDSHATARKACLDILRMKGVVDISGAGGDKEKSEGDLTPELAGRILAAMATAKRGGEVG